MCKISKMSKKCKMVDRRNSIDRGGGANWADWAEYDTRVENGITE